MATKFSATVLDQIDGRETATRYYIKSVGSFSLKPEAKQDRWLAVDETTVEVTVDGQIEALSRVRPLAGGFRVTVEEARDDMRQAIALHIDRGGRLVSGETVAMGIYGQAQPVSAPLTQDEAKAIAKRVCASLGHYTPTVNDIGELTDGSFSEPARLESAEAFEAQCEEWLAAVEEKRTEDLRTGDAT